MMHRKILVLALVSMQMIGAVPASAQLSVGISINLAPPPLPVYVQPPLPGPDYLWTPGYGAWDDDAYAYFWVFGTWVRAPQPGLLWTPPWWGWVGGAYLFHVGASHGPAPGSGRATPEPSPRAAPAAPAGSAAPAEPPASARRAP